MTAIHYDKDADLGLLKGMTVAILGYGSQGHAQALNLRDSGVKVVVAQRAGSDNYKKAVEDGFRPVSIAEACAQADWIQILLRDEMQPDVYEKEIKPHLKAGKVLGFSHGFSIRFETIQPPKDVDVVLIAPKAPGHLERRVFEEGKGVPMLIAVHQDASGKAKARALAYAKGCGGTRAGVLETTFAEETETDLFGEQTVLCGGVVELIKAGFETLVKAGYQPEIAYFECLHEMKLIVDMVQEGGLWWMNYSVSDTAEFGEYTRGPRVINAQSRAEMVKILAEIKSGQFANEWLAEYRAGKKKFLEFRAAKQNHPIEQVGARLRAMMPWLGKKEAKRRAA